MFRFVFGIYIGIVKEVNVFVFVYIIECSWGLFICIIFKGYGVKI